MMVIGGGCSFRDNNASSVSDAAAVQSANTITAIQYAGGFTLEQRQGYRILRVLTPWRDARISFSYALVPRGAKHPILEPGVVLVETPVRRIVLASTTFVVYFAMLGIEDSIAGISGCRMVNTPSVAARIQDGRIQEVGDGSGSAEGLNMERLLSLQPDLVMTFATGISQYDLHDRLREKDFKVAINSEYMETTPLGRTEWIKFIAAFFDKEDEAERLFADTAIRYANLTAMTRDVAQKPKVFCGSNYRGTWHMPGGNSYVARFLRDAGAAYLWEEDRGTGSTPLNIEAVLSRARHADYWLNPGVHRSREEIAAEDERYSVFPAFRAGRVYSDNAKMDAAGGNDIWETGVAYPDIVLADLISIFHPEILQDHRRTWYWQLPEKASERK
jgi:iron complex transport system substrate-binding protein